MCINNMIVLNYQDRRPLYEQIIEKFQMLIVKGALEADEQMPSVRRLAVELSINPNTIQRAYAVLETEGYIYSVKGRGNFVAPQQNFLEDRKKQIYQQFKTLAIHALDNGITKSSLIDCVNLAAGEGQA